MSMAIVPPNSEFNAQEQKSYNLVFIPPKPGRYSATNFAFNRLPKQIEGLTHLYGNTAGAKIKFSFRGTRIGILIQRAAGNGKLSVDIDGTAYELLNTGDSEVDAYNIPYMIATDLPPGEHVLTLTKIDSNVVSIQGFLVDDANAAQAFTRAAVDYHQMFDDSRGQPVSIDTGEKTIFNVDVWMRNAVITNTTGSPINVTLKDGNSRSIVGPFPVPANDFRAVPGPVVFYGGIRVSASAAGCYIVVGGQ
ncbi:hypothetical protein [Priestia megaterium]|uniref:hypothetical protein n=1 Tax=Priestia megaterium TaxID=1404 RepID=UPI000BF66487|nr:hypothetical protein [Priestia megaterium]PFJ03217.1 hypothetical protein COI84_02700 [Priestia megaterium]PGR11752.1 hypothetical protein COC62_14105 [Priestia megaterium]